MKLLENIVYVLRKSFRREERRKRKTEGSCVKKAEGKGGGTKKDERRQLVAVAIRRLLVCECACVGLCIKSV